jgi:hypothetical protein
VRAPSAAELLAIWEEVPARLPVEGALALLAAGEPEMPYDALARLPVGARDARLLTLRELIFGRALAGLATCPACGERVEVTLDTATLHAARVPDERAPLDVDADGHAVRFRLPDSLDLEAIAGAADVGAAAVALRRRCVLAARRGDVTVAADELPAEVHRAIAARMAAADPLGDVELAVECGACSGAWSLTLDIVSFLWSEVDTWARTMLEQVHVLATAYGWHEHDILAMTPRRRQHYRALLGP